MLKDQKRRKWNSNDLWKASGKRVLLSEDILGFIVKSTILDWIRTVFCSVYFFGKIQKVLLFI